MTCCEFTINVWVFCVIRVDWTVPSQKNWAHRWSIQMSPSMEFSSHGGALLKIQPDVSTQASSGFSMLMQKILANWNKNNIELLFTMWVYWIDRALRTYSKAPKKGNLPKLPVSQELCDAHLIFSPLWKIKWCITTVEAQVTTAMNHSSPSETTSRLWGSSHKSNKTKVENNHPGWDSDLMGFCGLTNPWVALRSSEETFGPRSPGHKCCCDCWADLNTSHGDKHK